MLEESWIKLVILSVVCSTLMGGCAGPGPTVSGSQATVHSENEYDPARWLDPHSPTFWLDYQGIYGPK